MYCVLQDENSAVSFSLHYKTNRDAVAWGIKHTTPSRKTHKVNTDEYKFIEYSKQRLPNGNYEVG